MVDGGRLEVCVVAVEGLLPQLTAARVERVDARRYLLRITARTRELGYTGSANLLVCYINQGRVEADHATSSPHRITHLLLNHPQRLSGDQ